MIKYFLFATAMFNGCREILDLLDFFGINNNLHLIYTFGRPDRNSIKIKK